MENIQALVREQQKIDESYTQILNAGFLPLGDLESQQITEWRESLRSARYIVAVCGQMKAGKSTLLNAMMFGRLVLPADDCVMTAKITVLRYSPEPAVEVKLYNQSEWESLKKYYEEEKAQGDEKLHADFHNELGKALLKGGISEHEMITTAGRVIKEPGLDSLKKYVSVVERGGICSPFVKEVTVYHNNKDFEGVDIVDTPGINDPNIMRTRVTTDWIHKADAVIYVSYAGQALAKADKDFITSHLGGVLPSHRVLVLNKIDCAAEDQVRSYVDELRHSSDPQVKAIVAPADQTCFVSAGAAIIKRARNLEESGIKLDEHTETAVEELEYNLEETPYLDEDRDGFARMESVIAQRLIATKGEALLSSHQENIKVFNQHVTEHFEMLESQLSARFERLNMSQEQLQTLIDSLREQNKMVKNTLEGFDDSITSIANEVLDDLILGLERFEDKQIQDFTHEWNARKIDFSSFAFVAQNVFAELWSSNRTILTKSVEEAEDVGVEKLEEAINSFERMAHGKTGELDLATLVNFAKIQIDMSRALKRIIRESADRAESKVKEKVGAIDAPEGLKRFKSIFTNEEINKIRAHVISEIRSATKKSMKELTNEIQNTISILLQKASSKVSETVGEALEKGRRDLEEEIKSGRDDYNKRHAALKTEESELNQAKDRILSQLPSI